MLQHSNECVNLESSKELKLNTMKRFTKKQALKLIKLELRWFLDGESEPLDLEISTFADSTVRVTGAETTERLWVDIEQRGYTRKSTPVLVGVIQMAKITSYADAVARLAEMDGDDWAFIQTPHQRYAGE